MTASEVAYVTLSVIAAFAIEAALFFMYCKDLDARRPSYTVAWLALIFSAGTIIAFVVLNQGLPQAAASRSWFSSGWKQKGLYLFNIPINTWQSYTLLIVYQITRTILGALVSNIFRTYVSVNILGSKNPNEKDRFFIMLGYAATTLFNYWTSVTDVFSASN